MNAAAAIALLSEIVANLPAAITTGQQVIRLVNDGYLALSASLADEEATPAEINALVAKVVANSASIQALD
jgi:hypothetical protein